MVEEAMMRPLAEQLAEQRSTVTVVVATTRPDTLTLPPFVLLSNCGSGRGSDEMKSLLDTILQLRNKACNRKGLV